MSDPVTIQQLIDAGLDVDTIEQVTMNNGYTGDTTTNRDGVTIDTLEGRLKRLGFDVPIAYAGAISFAANDRTKTISFSGNIYAPRVEDLPFTTSGTWVGDDEDKFYSVQLSQVPINGVDTVNIVDEAVTTAKLDTTLQTAISQVATNTSQISTNTSNIASNTAAIGAISGLSINPPTYADLSAIVSAIPSPSVGMIVNVTGQGLATYQPASITGLSSSAWVRSDSVSHSVFSFKARGTDAAILEGSIPTGYSYDKDVTGRYALDTNGIDDRDSIQIFPRTSNVDYYAGTSPGAGGDNFIDIYDDHTITTPIDADHFVVVHIPHGIPIT